MLQAHKVSGCRGSQDNRHMKVVRLSTLAHAAFSPRKYSWYPFLLENPGFGARIK